MDFIPAQGFEGCNFDGVAEQFPKKIGLVIFPFLGNKDHPHSLFEIAAVFGGNVDRPVFDLGVEFDCNHKYLWLDYTSHMHIASVTLLRKGSGTFSHQLSVISHQCH
jgi:hypothetical protein